ncbi:Rmf/CrpP family protein [Aureimonas mangrovi]|uniref:Rmf/CrpP family protein n=1 Tax=Aureimonas mangrovi TaxID=2758041 RepID=UPI00163DD46D|nr:Rmf/CrpP family protein [Aureimonas mangrovi]
MTKDAFAQGKLAFEHNHPMSSCEYPVGSSLRAEWMAGWTEASNAKPNRAGQTSEPQAQRA